MRDPWRLRCPRGHSSLRIRSDWYYCQSCDSYYEGSPHDPKHEDLPVDEEPMPASARAQVSTLGMVVVFWLLALFLVAGVGMVMLL